MGSAKLREVFAVLGSLEAPVHALDDPTRHNKVKQMMFMVLLMMEIVLLIDGFLQLSFRGVTTPSFRHPNKKKRTYENRRWTKEDGVSNYPQEWTPQAEQPSTFPEIYR